MASYQVALETLRDDHHNAAVAQVDLHTAVVGTDCMSCTEEVAEMMVDARGNRLDLVVAVVVDLAPEVGCDSVVVRQSAHW